MMQRIAALSATFALSGTSVPAINLAYPQPQQRMGAVAKAGRSIRADGPEKSKRSIAFKILFDH